MPIILLLLIGVPLIEIALFVEIGGRIGLAATLAVVVGTAILGAVMLRLQGVSALGSINRSLERGEFPAEGLRDGALLVVAAALLLLPGFLTDTIGLALLLAPVRRAIGALAFRQVASRFEIRRHTAAARRAEPPERLGPVIEGEAQEIPERGRGK